MKKRKEKERTEVNEMFYNDFIPCGLFYDLMDKKIKFVDDLRYLPRICNKKLLFH
jgi:hypothetical protein